MSADLIQAVTTIQACKKGQTQFASQTSLEQRAQYLESVAVLIESHSEEFVEAEFAVTKIDKAFLRRHLIRYILHSLRQVAQELRGFDYRPNEILSPVGLVAVITPWALGLRFFIERFAPSFAAGNSTIWKPSPDSQQMVPLISHLFKQAGLPPESYGFVTGDKEIGEFIVQHPSVNAISFVGSSRVGEIIMQKTAGKHKRLQLQLSTKNAAVVMADCDFRQQMPNILNSCLAGQGQLCWNTRRILLQESIANDFVAQLKSSLDSLSPKIRLRSPHQLDFVRTAVEKMKQEHGKIVWGGDDLSDDSNLEIRPVFILDLPNCSEYQQQDLELPLVTMGTIKYQHEAGKWLNAGYLGQAASLWGDSAKMQKLAVQLQYGHFWINSWLEPDDKPICGLQQSSFGPQDYRFNGLFFSDAKTLTTLF